MRTVLLAALLFAGAASAQGTAAPTSANTVVDFVHPEKFVDAGDQGFGGAPSKRVLAELGKAIVALGAKYLGPGEALKIDVSDVDLAGRFEPGPQAGDTVRVMRDSDWPRIALHYVLKKDGVIASEGDAQISDMNYLDQQRPGRSSEHLYYEKRMLQDWFSKTFKPQS